MLIDGRAIAADTLREVRNMVSHCAVKPHMTVFTCAPNFETRTFLAMKKRKAVEAGIGVNVIEFPEHVTTADVLQSLALAPMQTDGIIVQLPFPKHIDIDTVLEAIPAPCDIDALRYGGAPDELLPPVVGAIDEIARRHGVPFVGAHVVVVGSGRLVGKPAAKYAARMGAQVTVVTKDAADSAEAIRSADILILGVGRPNLIVPDMIRDGAVIFDAGTTEEGGVLVGDADPRCAEKASLFTPVPGGIGPVTVAALLRNVVLLAERHTNRP